MKKTTGRRKRDIRLTVTRQTPVPLNHGLADRVRAPRTPERTQSHRIEIRYSHAGHKKDRGVPRGTIYAS